MQLSRPVDQFVERKAFLKRHDLALGVEQFPPEAVGPRT
jgi:hypothetical protein